MKKSIPLLLVLLATSTTRANLQGVSADGYQQTGVVVTADKKSFTIKPEAGKEVTLDYGSDMGKKVLGFAAPPNDPWAVTSDQIKVGIIVRVVYSKTKDKEKEVLVCKRAMIIVERLGTKEIDFAPLLAKDKDTLPKFVLRLQLQSRRGLGEFWPHRTVIHFNEGATVQEVRDYVKEFLSGTGKGNRKLVARVQTQNEWRKWKVKEVGDSKLLIESYREGEKDEPLNAVEIEAKDLPKDRQPRVRLIDPGDPSK